VPAARSSDMFQRSARNKWLVPLLSVALVVSLAVNFRYRNAVEERNRAEDLWIEAFKGDRNELRGEAAKALGDLAKTSPAAANALVEGLSDPRPAVRLSALDGLEAAGPAAHAATAALLKLQNTEDNDLVRRRVGELQKILQSLPETETPLTGTLIYWGLPALVVVGLAAGIFVALRRSSRAVRKSR
jgi:HEAT repeats